MADTSVEILNYVNKRNGFYIECGANDGIEQSNTRCYETELGWRGLLIEASPIACAKCRTNRSLETNIIENCALVSSEYKGLTVTGDFDGHPMASIQGARRSNGLQVEVPARTLSSILNEHGIEKIDLFSLDVEGYELDVLKGIDFMRHRPMWMVIEIYEKDFSNVLMFLAHHSYMFHRNLSCFNRWDNPAWDGTHNDYLFVDAQVPEIGA